MLEDSASLLHVVLDIENSEIALKGFRPKIHILHKVANNSQSFVCEQISEDAFIQFTDVTKMIVADAQCREVMDQVTISTLEEVERLRQQVVGVTPSLITTLTSSLINGAINAVVPEFVKDVLLAQGVKQEHAELAGQGVYYGMLLANGLTWFTVVILIMSLLTEILGAKSSTVHKAGQYASFGLVALELFMAYGLLYAMTSLVGNAVGRKAGLWAEKKIVSSVLDSENNFFKPARVEVAESMQTSSVKFQMS